MRQGPGFGRGLFFWACRPVHEKLERQQSPSARALEGLKVAYVVVLGAALNRLLHLQGDVTDAKFLAGDLPQPPQHRLDLILGQSWGQAARGR